MAFKHEDIRGAKQRQIMPISTKGKYLYVMQVWYHSHQRPAEAVLSTSALTGEPSAFGCCWDFLVSFKTSQWIRYILLQFFLQRVRHSFSKD
jgi:hypothetical protein